MNYKKLLLFFLIISAFILFSCSTLKTKQNFPEVVKNSSKLNNREQTLQKIGQIRMKGHINIIHPEKDGSIFGNFKYTNLDSLHIQFKDILGRKVAQLDLNDDNFSLWLQREDKHLSGKKLPPDYAYLTLDNKITISELRNILLGIPISESMLKEDKESKPNITHFVSNNNLIAAYKLNETQKYIKRVTFSENVTNSEDESKIGKILYTEYESRSNILMPSNIIIENFQGPYKVRIKITNIEFENTPLT